MPETNALLSGIAEAVPGAEITAACGKTVFWNSRHIAESEKLHKAVYCDYASPLDVPANKIVAELPDEAAAREIAAGARCKLQCYRGEKWYAFMPAASGKTAAIKALAETCGIRPEDIVAFGDDLNDIEMLKLCGTGVAVANAVPQVLEAADEITLSNDDDGPAQWRTVSCGCSRSSVTRPTRMASSSARSLWQSICVNGEEILTGRPLSSMKPLAVCAHFKIM